jgi:KDO2-lipid IV(A) lauroyltransferase
MAEQVDFETEQKLGSRGGAAAWLESVFVRALMGGLSRLPRSAQRAMVSGAAHLAARLDRRHSDAARSFLRQALGCAQFELDGERRVVQAYRHLFQVSLDAEAFERHVPQESLLDHFSVKACEGFDDVVRAGKGGIMVTGHLGEWEAGSAVMPHVGMKPAYVVSRPPKNRYLSEHMLRVREDRGLTIMPRRGGMKQVGKILESGGWIAMLLDQRPRGKHVVAPFFGRPAPCERSAAVLMKRMGVPLVIGANFGVGRPFEYELVLSRVVRPEELAQLSVEELVTLINGELEALILSRPDQYFWLHDRYRGAPAPLEPATCAPTDA